MSEIEYEIPFTRYLLPNGAKTPTTFKSTGKTARIAKALVGFGLLFECEILTTGEVSLTVHDPEIEEDISIQLCENGAMQWLGFWGT